MEPLQTITNYYNFVPKTWAPCPFLKIIGAEGQSPLITEKVRLHLAWDFIHVGFGLQGEALECITEDLNEEEIGDISYYLFILFNLLDVTPEEIVSKLIEPALNNHDCFEIIVVCEKLANYIKKAFIYNQGLDKYQGLLAEHALDLFIQICLYGDAINIIIANQAKLTARYPDLAFSTTDSAARADKQPGPELQAQGKKLLQDSNFSSSKRDGALWEGLTPDGKIIPIYNQPTDSPSPESE